MTRAGLAAPIVAALSMARLDAQTPPVPQSAATSAIELVTLPTDSPLVSIRVMVRAGSIHDPAGKEGLSALTALMLGDSGTAKRSYSELAEALYPMAAGIGVHTDREVTVFTAQVHRDTLADFAPLLTETLVNPGFREDDFIRHREQLIAFLTTTLRSASDELLGLELVQQEIFRGHPYGHAPAGTVDGLKSLTLQDVRHFYRDRYTQASVIVGIAGGYPQAFPASFRHSLASLPAGRAEHVALPPPRDVAGRHFTLVDKETEATGIHFGYPLPINRADEDFYPLMVANSFFGEHRTFHGRLMQELRGKRGLNYGDYSYIEFWDNPPGTTNPAPNHPRRQQYFSVWVRPVVPPNARFALRAALYELDRLVRHGLSDQEFDLTRDFLISYSKLWARSLADRLGFHMDSRFYGMPYFIDHIEERLAAITAADVNRAIEKYLQSEDLLVVMITGNAAAVQQQLTADRPSPIAYESAVPPDVVDADAMIAALPLEPASIRIVPIEQTFSGRRP